MAVTTFAASILPGRTQAWKDGVAEIKGARWDAYQESRKRMGVTREVVSLQETPVGDFVCVLLEGEDPGGVVGRYLASDEPFDQWFADTFLRGVHGMGDGAPPANPLYLDWSA